jgi:hypothetical protein
MPSELKQSQENIDKSESQSTINNSLKYDKSTGPDTLVPIPDEKEEEVVTKAQELQPEREATFKDYLVCSLGIIWKYTYRLIETVFYSEFSHMLKNGISC